jgi:hypothetical protein
MPARFTAFAGACAILAGVAGFLYSVSFVVLQNNLLSALFLTSGALLSVAVLVGLYSVLREHGGAYAVLGLALGAAGAAGSLLHGGYDLSNAINPPDTIPPAVSNLPSPVDPRGLATFGITGLAILIFAWLIVQGKRLPRTLGYLGYLLGILLIIVYLGRLIVLTASSPLILIPAALTGFIVSPLWNIWLGLELRKL